MRRVLLALLAIALTPAAAARRPAPPTDELRLDLAHPVIAATVAGVPLRLLVSLDTRDAVELNPDAAARLPVAWEEGAAIEVGRVLLPGRQARVAGEIGGKAVDLVVATHARACCAGADGEIGPEQLPYARIRLIRAMPAGAPPAVRERRFAAIVSDRAGLTTLTAPGPDGIAIKFAPARAQTIATASAAAILVAAEGGRWTGAARPLALAFGIERPARPLRLLAPASLAGLPVDTLMVRVADFRGGRPLPSDPATPADMVVTARPRASQHDWPAVSLGADLLDRCAEIAVERVPALVIALRCTDAAR